MDQILGIIKSRLLHFNQLRSNNAHHIREQSEESWSHWFGQLKMEERIRAHKEDEFYREISNQATNSQHQNELMWIEGFKHVNSFISKVCKNSQEIFQIYEQKQSQIEQISSKGSLEDTLQSVRKFFYHFMNKNNFKNECLELESMFDSHYDDLETIDAIKILKWITKWSRNVHQNYCRVLQKQRILVMSQKNQAKSNGSLTAQKSLQMVKNRCSSEQTIIINDLFIANRNLCFGYFVEQLTSYYKDNQILDLDFSYLRQLKKRQGKSQLLKPKNMAKATKNIIESSGNKELQLQILRYTQNYFAKFPERKLVVKVEKKKILPCLPSLSTQSVVLPPSPKYFPSVMNGRDVAVVPPSLSPLRKRAKLFGENDNNNESQLLSPKISEFELLLKPQDLEARIKKLKLINSNHEGNFVNLDLSIRSIKNRRSQAMNDLNSKSHHFFQHESKIETSAVVIGKEHLKKREKSNFSPKPSKNLYKSQSYNGHNSLQKLLNGERERFLRCQSIQSKVKVKDNSDVHLQQKAPNHSKQRQSHHISVLQMGRKDKMNRYPKLQRDEKTMATDQIEGEYNDIRMKPLKFEFTDIRVTSRKRMLKYFIQQQSQ